MLCKNCGKELPVSGQFCPFCGAPTEQVGVDDETALFPTMPDGAADDLNVPIDLSAFDAAFEDNHHTASWTDGAPSSDPFSAPGPRTPARPAQQPVRRPAAGAQQPPRRAGMDGQQPPRRAGMDGQQPPRRTAAPRTPQSVQRSAARTTYFDQSGSDDEPYRRPSRAGRAVAVVLTIIVVLGLIGGGVYFVMSRRPDENLTLAEKYLGRGKFDDALAAFESALGDAKDPAAIQLQIDQLKSFQQARELVESGDYASALATLNDLRGRITDKTSPLGEAVDELIARATLGQSDEAFATDLLEAEAYLNDEKYDACAGKLDALEADSTLTDDQRREVARLREQLTKAQEAIQRQQANQQQAEQKKQDFRDQIASIEENDEKIAAAATTEEEFDLTSASFEAWDSLLASMYDHLATLLNADQYAAEEASYEQWIKERDAGAENAAREGEDEVAGQLAAASFKQSYTKTRCYKLLDMM